MAGSSIYWKKHVAEELIRKIFHSHLQQNFTLSLNGSCFMLPFLRSLIWAVALKLSEQQSSNPVVDTPSEGVPIIDKNQPKEHWTPIPVVSCGMYCFMARCYTSTTTKLVHRRTVDIIAEAILRLKKVMNKKKKKKRMTDQATDKTWLHFWGTDWVKNKRSLFVMF